MNAGRELDALIAEKVMGHEIWKSAFTNIWADNTKGGTVAPYSTDIAAAWLVVAALTDDSKTFFTLSRYEKLGPNPDGEPYEQHWCARFNGKRDWRYHGEHSESAAHAICLAALRKDEP